MNSDELKERLERIESAVTATKPVMTLAELCRYTGYTEQYVYQMTSHREIPHYKRGKMLFFNRAEIDSWLMSYRVKTRKEIEQEAQTYCAVK